MEDRRKIKTTPSTPHQKTLSKLEKIFGNQIQSTQIWHIFKSNSFEKKATIHELCSMTGKKYSEVMSQTKSRNQGEKPKNEEEEQQKILMRTSEDVFNRIKWDEKYNKHETKIGYEDRFVGIMEASFDSWADRDVSSETFIPWHRVQYFKVGTQIIWDRKNKINTVFT
jgi:uncharacterized protein (UPF0248 family)